MSLLQMKASLSKVAKCKKKYLSLIVRSKLPLTPFHYPLAYLIYKFDKRLSLPGLVVGSMFPDFEIPIIISLFGKQVPDHLLLHSVLGAITIGTFLSLLFTFLIYPTLVHFLFRVDKNKVECECRLSSTLIFSVLLGNLSHVFLDLFTHEITPIFWPLFPSNMLNIIPSIFGGVENSSLITHTFMGISLIFLFLKNRENLLKKLLVE
jgi:hypothetical protein